MHVSGYMFLCMHCHGYSYASIISQICIVRSLYVVCVIMMLLLCYDADVLAEKEKEL